MPVRFNSLKAKRVLLTGGTTGIGRATLMLLAEEGARVVTYGRDRAHLDDALEAVRALTERAGGEVHGMTADSASAEDLERVFRTVDDKLGGLDILVANAALGAQPVHEMEELEWRYVIDTNLSGYMACAQGALTRMDRQGGQLLFVSSIATIIKKPGESVYAASKAGVQAFAETLRREVQDRRIRVSVIQPGATGTDMQPGGDDARREAIAKDEMLYAEEVAEAILFALTRSERADVVNLRIEPLIQTTS
ncbi:MULTISPECIES: SDR family oxidoreductase [Asticcacaulis]|uniref:SDR family oxidoreductase n=1 Tax=Asticcacaulis TaxID=76890 RepID=UPI001AE11DED|nr:MULTISPECIES: SDR family oxidoreductase [Asticcacaulis]MBP2159362.1 NAD(P)-dependent dehydrogenase (short-subunit alcohol dehydrogenase family) [Asticcacaulis solisilvae]MDR6800407.1 NAD(P)-dependent dehydrogenase (short-subunit alcohol dehydrogenase family) [Asticcacaulis sp. BE141]